MAWQAEPSAPQICHWYWNVIGLEPLQVPGFAVAVVPTVAAPLIVGGELFDGATAERDVTAPAALTTTRPATAAIATTRRREFISVPLSARCRLQLGERGGDYSCRARTSYG